MAADPIERLLRTLLDRERIANTLSAAHRATVRALFERIADIFRDIDPPGAQRSRYKRERTERALAEIQRELREIAPELEKALRGELARVGRDMAVRARLSLVATLGTEAADLFTPEVGITQQRLRAILRTDPIRGRTLREHTETWSASQYNAVRDQIRLGMSAEETTEQITERVLGVKAGFQSDTTGRMRKTGGPGAHRLYRGGVLSRAEKDVEAIVRTAVTHVSNVGMLETFRANETVVSGVEYVATLDSRTCFVAGTGVLTPSGYLPIEDIRPGDVVIGGSRLPRRVAATRTASKTDMARVHLSNGHVVECTADHRWLTDAQEWVEARDLKTAQTLACGVRRLEVHGRSGRDAEGLAARPVTVRRVELFTRPTTVYDIQVERDHSFIVADVVVHNSAICLALDGTVWPLDSADIVTPGADTHYGCRSVLAPVISWDALGLEPPDDGTRAARDMRTVDDDELGKRRVGKVEQIPSSVKAEEWLRAQRESVQDHMLGRKRAELFRRGEVSLRDLIRDDNTVIPLDELLN